MAPSLDVRSALPRLAALSVVAVVLVFHFGATLLYLTPLNPIKARLLLAVTAYMDPYFTQSWSMFAPEPILDDDRVLLVSCRVPNGAETRDEPLVDVTSRLRETQWTYRLTPALRLLRQQMSPVALISPPPDPLADHLAKLADDQDPELAAAGKEVERARERDAALGLRLLVRVASAECERLHGRRDTVAVRPVLVTVAAPPFSRRMTDERGPAKKVDFGWFPSEQLAHM